MAKLWRTVLWGLNLLLPLAMACEGSIGAHAVQTPPRPPMSSRTPTPDECVSVTPKVGAWPLQRLTSRQLERTVQAVLFDTSGSYVQRLGATDEVLNARLRYFFAASGNSVVAEGLILAAEKVAESAMTAPQLSAQLACPAGDPIGQRLCAKRIVETIGRRLWRRSLSAAEVEDMLGVYDAARADKASDTFADGVKSTLHALLAAPDFFFLQQPKGESGRQVKLTGTALAERLALTLWQEAPDDNLLTAAESGALDSPTGFEQQLSRLLQDRRADLAFADFIKHWLSPEKTSSIDFALLSATRQPQLYAKFEAPSTSTAGDGVQFTHALDGYLASNAVVATGTMKNLLLADELAVNEAVARNLTLAAPAPGATELRKPETPRRRGLLGQPALLTAFGRFESSDPVHRGVLLLRQVLCLPLSPPDMMVNTTLPEATQFKTTRDRFVAATKDSACAGCHALINPLGFAFENFDAVGAYREQEGGHPVDATATLPIDLKNGQPAKVDGLADLAAVLADDAAVRSCLGKQFATWALHRGLTEAESCAISDHTGQFAQGAN